MKKIEVSNTFKKSYKKIDKKYRKKIEDYITTLANGESLPPAARDHNLNGKMKEYRSFKLDNNLRVVYQIFPDTLYIVDIGTHSIYESLYEKLSTYIKSSQLNPLLFEDNKLKPEIKDKVLEIVDEFLKYAEVDIRVLDVRLVGSNAAYNYNEYSDLDIHIVTDLSEVSDPESIARLYFDSVKSNFKNSYDIKIKGIDVELYVEDINSSSMSNGIYSVTQESWIKEPVPTVEPSEEDIAEAERIEDEILDSLEKVNSIDELQSIVDKLYLMRKDSLLRGGETDPGNLAFKSLRNKGVLDKIKDTMKKSKAKELSLESKKIKEGILASSTNYNNVRESQGGKDAMTNWREYWVYKELKDNYNVKVTKNKVEIRFKEDNDLYASFRLEEDKEFGEYLIYDNSGDLLNSEMDFTTTYDEAVCSCLYYFYSRY